MLEDLSFSKIVDIVQNDNKIGATLLTKIAEEKTIVDANYKDAEIRLQQLKTEQLRLRKASLSVLKHLKKETPLVVQRDNFIVVVTSENISVERNVL